MIGLDHWIKDSIPNFFYPQWMWCSNFLLFWFCLMVYSTTVHHHPRAPSLNARLRYQCVIVVIRVSENLDNPKLYWLRLDLTHGLVFECDLDSDLQMFTIYDIRDIVLWSRVGMEPISPSRIPVPEPNLCLNMISCFVFCNISQAFRAR